MSGMLITLLLVAGVGVVIWKRCDIFPQMCDDGIGGKTFEERGFVDSGVVNPGSTPTPGKGSAGTVAAVKATPNAKGHKLPASHTNTSAPTTPACTGSYTYKPNVGLVDTGCGKPASSAAAYASARFSRIAI